MVEVRGGSDAADVDRGRKALEAGEAAVITLAAGAGISRPSFYFYFASKEAVLLALLDRVAQEARQGSAEVLQRFTEDPALWLRRRWRTPRRATRACPT